MQAPAPFPTSHAKADFRAGYIILISLIAALGGLLFGYDWVVIGGAKPFFERYFQLHEAVQSGWANSCALLGCLVGALGAGALSDRFGRKRPLAAAALIFAVTSIGNALAHTFAGFVAWRICGGYAIGLASNLSPMYIAEVSPPAWRGRLVSLNQLTIVVGILLAQFVNWYLVRNLPAGATDAWIASSWYGQDAWRWMFGLTAIPAVLFCFGTAFIPESPRWLATRQHRSRAVRILEKIGGSDYAERTYREIEYGEAEVRTKPGLRDLFDPRMRKVIVLGVTLAVFQQWCGINVIFNYAEEIFRAAGYDVSSVLKNIAWTGSVNLVFTLAAFAIVDRGGRRPLMLIGAGGLAAVYAIMGIGYHSGVQGVSMLLLVLAAIAFYAMSLAPVTWVVISEIFPNRIRGAAISVAVTALWIACFILTYTFPILNRRLGAAGTFWIYAAICVSGFLFIAFRLPETKGKSLEQLERELVD